VSVNVLSVIPTDHLWQPSTSAAAAAELVVRRLDPEAVEVAAEWSEHVMFADCGSNWEGVRCPSCNEDIEAWFGDRISAASDESQFKDLAAVTPCCGTRTTLNDLTFSWPAGFASFRIRVETPTRAWQRPSDPWFSDSEIELVAEALGAPVRQVLAHY
jgi:hypothetical protein